MIQPVLVSRRGPAVVLTINRPQDGNRIDSEAMTQLQAALDAADAEPSVRVIVITGSREAFCSGGRIDGHPGGTVQQQLAFAQAFCNLRDRMTRTAAPIVAAVEGPCTAGGMALLAACDLAIATEDAHFSFPEVAFGLFPLLAMASVYDNLPAKVAMDLFYTGRNVHATEALELRVVNQVVLRDAFWDAVDARCEALARMNPAALMLGRKAWYAMAAMHPSARHDYAQTALAAMLAAHGSGAVPH